jgi:hypothetical protein
MESFTFGRYRRNQMRVDATTGGITRRQLLERAGLGSLALAGGGFAPRSELSMLAAGNADSPEAFLVTAFQQRARAMTTGNLALLDGLYDPGSSQLSSFESSRADFYHSGLGAKWHARVLDYQSTPNVVVLGLTSSDAVVRVYETIDVPWIALPRPAPVLSPEAAAWRRESPERCQPAPTGPQGELHTLVGVRHEMELIRSNGQWTIIRDGYNERDIFGASPDFTPGTWSDDGGPGPSVGAESPAAATAMHQRRRFRQMGLCAIDWFSVQSYMETWCSSRNTGYCNYCNTPYCDGDCANFVSQCWSAGNHHWDKYWFCTQNYSCNCHDTPSVAWGGSVPWINVDQQHTWAVNTTGWGSDVSNVTSLLLGDFINYDWTGGGIWDHVAIVHSLDSNGYPLISCHCYDRCAQPWSDGGAAKYRFTHVGTSYPC